VQWCRLMPTTSTFTGAQRQSTGDRVVRCWHRGSAETLNKQKPHEELPLRKYVMRTSAVDLDSF
jgi:hypothetical protein